LSSIYFILWIRRLLTSTLFPYNDALPISVARRVRGDHRSADLVHARVPGDPHRGLLGLRVDEGCRGAARPAGGRPAARGGGGSARAPQGGAAGGARAGEEAGLLGSAVRPRRRPDMRVGGAG